MKKFSKNNVYISKEEKLAQSYFQLKRVSLKHDLFGDGQSAELTREVVVRGLAVGLLPYDPLQDRVLLIQQFRIGAFKTPGAHSPWLWEIIAGMAEANEHPETVVIREAEEEAGLKLEASQLQHIYTYWPSPGMTSEQFSLYFAFMDLPEKNSVFGLAEEGEDILAKTFAFTEIFSWLEEGKITNAHTIIALQKLKILRNDFFKDIRCAN